MESAPTPAAQPKSRRRWNHFNLRTLLIVVALLAVPFAYVAHEGKIVQERKAMLAEIESAGGGFFSSRRTTPGFWNRFPNWPAEAIAAIGSPDQRDSPSTGVIRVFLGDELVLVIWLPTTVSPAEEARIKKCIPEAYMWRFK